MERSVIFGSVTLTFQYLNHFQFRVTREMYSRNGHQVSDANWPLMNKLPHQFVHGIYICIW